MLPKKLRITRSADIKRAFRTRYRYFGDVFRVYISQSREPNFKLLVVVSKKVHKRAHERNRIKRKVHQIFADLHRQGKLPPMTSVVVQATSKNIIERSQSQLRDELIPQVSKIYKKMMKQ